MSTPHHGKLALILQVLKVMQHCTRAPSLSILLIHAPWEIGLLTMQDVMLYLTISATLCALRTVTTVLFSPGAATRGAFAAPTVRFKFVAVARSLPS